MKIKAAESNAADELKLDGYRLQTIKDGEKVRLLSRRGNEFTRKFAKIAGAT